MYQLGQRWFSEAEPELGIGIVIKVEAKLVTINFPAVALARTYSTNKPPIKRVVYDIGDTIYIVENDRELSAVVSEVKEQNGVIFYFCAESVYPEMLLKSDLFFTNPQDKILAGNFDRNAFFELRYDSFLAQRKYQLMKNKGMLGPKVALLPHQMSVTSEAAKRTSIRMMLADEVGLGKTIEAALILSSLIMRSKVSKVLILTPDSLINQWFVELYRKFNLSFALLQTPEDLPKKNEVAPFYITNFSATDDQEISNFLLSNDWDMIVVDEAHQVSSTNKKHPNAIEILRMLATKSPHMLLLTATPEILGPQEHFERLSLLDPERFNSYEGYIQDFENYQKIIPQINKLLAGNATTEEVMNVLKIDGQSFHFKEEFINFLIDCHGTGRIYFRNTRENLERHGINFPERKLVAHPLKMDGKINDKIVLEQKAMIITEVLAKNPGEKLLVICHSKQLVLSLQKMILENLNAKVACFHSEQSPLERDRQSAYFADPDGAQIMLCTEAGSEGRNFEFAHHLFLLDIPKVPDQLEQRIGRLDRIGQSRNISIHVPYVEQTFEHILFLFYKDVVKSFSKCPKGAMSLYAEIRDELAELLNAPFDGNTLASFLESANKRYDIILDKLAHGHDQLLDLSSFSSETAKTTIQEISQFKEDNDLRSYLARVFDLIGIETVELNDYSDYAKPSDNMRIPSYPALTEEGLRYSYDRTYALKHDNIAFMSWEHPLAIGTMELFVDSELGNVTVTMAQEKMPFHMAFECIYRLEAVASKSEDINMFFPLTPLRALIDISGADLTAKVKMSALKGKLVDVSDEYKEQLKNLPKKEISDLIKKTKSLVSARVPKFTQDAIELIKAHFHGELARLGELKKRNPLVSDAEIQKLECTRDEMIKRVENSQVSLDSIRLIIGA